MADALLVMMAGVVILVFAVFVFLALRPRKSAVALHAPRVMFPPMILDNTGPHEFKSVVPLDNDYDHCVLRYADGHEKEVRAKHMHPKHPILTLLAQNTDGGRPWWVWDPSYEETLIRGESDDVRLDEDVSGSKKTKGA